MEWNFNLRQIILVVVIHSSVDYPFISISYFLPFLRSHRTLPANRTSTRRYGRCGSREGEAPEAEAEEVAEATSSTSPEVGADAERREPGGGGPGFFFSFIFFLFSRLNGLYTGCPRFLRGNRLPRSRVLSFNRKPPSPPYWAGLKIIGPFLVIGPYKDRSFFFSLVFILSLSSKLFFSSSLRRSSSSFLPRDLSVNRG